MGIFYHSPHADGECMELEIKATKREFLLWLFRYKLDAHVEGQHTELFIGPDRTLESQRVRIALQYLIDDEYLDRIVSDSIERDERYRCSHYFDVVVTGHDDTSTVNLIANDSKRLMELFAVDVKGSFAPADATEPDPDPAISEGLTDREITVAEYLADGMQHEEIAKVMDIKLNTVRSHAQNITEKVKAALLLDEIERGTLGQILRDSGFSST